MLEDETHSLQMEEINMQNSSNYILMSNRNSENASDLNNQTIDSMHSGNSQSNVYQKKRFSKNN
jgi:hypothetical protein